MFTTAALDYKILPKFLFIPQSSIIKFNWFSDPKEILKNQSLNLNN